MEKYHKGITLAEASKLTGLGEQAILKANLSERARYAYDQIKDLVDVQILANVDSYDDGKRHNVHSLTVVTTFNGRVYSVNSHKDVLHVQAVDFNNHDYHNRQRANEISHGLKNVKKATLPKLTALLLEAEAQIVYLENKAADELKNKQTAINLLDAVNENLGLKKSYSDYSKTTVYRGVFFKVDFEINVDESGTVSVKNSISFKFNHGTSNVKEFTEELIDFITKLKSLEE